MMFYCVAAVLMSSQVRANTATEPYINTKKPIAAPAGFAGICDRYQWACARDDVMTRAGLDELKLARQVNRTVNLKTRSISDRRQYGDDEVWALPTARGGDCEDFVLLKKMELIRHGVAPGKLLIATVLDRRKASHAVLVLRTDRGDLVLDNVRNQILPWWKTGYSFLRIQNPDAPSKWSAALAGGVFR
jgi:predicted transglutaminase-like cysteine proteinase